MRSLEWVIRYMRVPTLLKRLSIPTPRSLLPSRVVIRAVMPLKANLSVCFPKYPGSRPSWPTGPQSAIEVGTLLNVLGQTSYWRNTKFVVDLPGSSHGPNHLICNFGKVIQCLWNFTFFFFSILRILMRLTWDSNEGALYDCKAQHNVLSWYQSLPLFLKPVSLSLLIVFIGSFCFHSSHVDIERDLLDSTIDGQK